MSRRYAAAHRAITNAGCAAVPPSGWTNLGCVAQFSAPWEIAQEVMWRTPSALISHQCGSQRVTALHCAVASGKTSLVEDGGDGVASR